MELLAEALLVLHFIGLASLLGGFLVQVKDETKVINMAMFSTARNENTPRAGTLAPIKSTTLMSST